MAYENRQGLGYLIRKTNAHDTAENLAASAAVYGGYLVTKPCQVSRLMFYLTENVAADSTAPVVEANKRPTYNSGTGETLIDQITLADGATVGQVYFARPSSPVQLDIGDELSFEHVTQGVDASTATGQGFYDAELIPMGVGSQSDEVESA